jgi:hypothetical protein
MSASVWSRISGNVSVVLKTIKHVQCERCGTQFEYELVRETEKAPHGFALTQARAEERARKQAEQEAQQRLASESDLVRCPSCGCINEQMRQAYELTTSREKKKLLSIVATTAAGVVLASLVLLSMRDWNIHLLYIGALCLVACVATLRKVLRKEPPVVSRLGSRSVSVFKHEN